MKTWIARKLFDLALWLDFNETERNCSALTVACFLAAQQGALEQSKRKPGRPAGSKDKAPRKRTVQS